MEENKGYRTKKRKIWSSHSTRFAKCLNGHIQCFRSPTTDYRQIQIEIITYIGLRSFDMFHTWFIRSFRFVFGGTKEDARYINQITQIVYIWVSFRPFFSICGDWKRGFHIIWRNGNHVTTRPILSCCLEKCGPTKRCVVKWISCIVLDIRSFKMWFSWELDILNWLLIYIILFIQSKFWTFFCLSLFFFPQGLPIW
jgi:hypothetical protein